MNKKITDKELLELCSKPGNEKKIIEMLEIEKVNYDPDTELDQFEPD